MSDAAKRRAVLRDGTVRVICGLGAAVVCECHGWFQLTRDEEPGESEVKEILDPYELTRAEALEQERARVAELELLVEAFKIEASARAALEKSRERQQEIYDDLGKGNYTPYAEEDRLHKMALLSHKAACDGLDRALKAVGR